MNQFTIHYDDFTTFVGNPLNSDWMKIDEEKKIAKLEYIFGSIKIDMCGYKQYNHLLECVAMGSQGIAKIFLMGREENRTEVVLIDLTKQSISKCYKELGSEYENQILTGWKEGELSEPNTKIFGIAS